MTTRINNPYAAVSPRSLSPSLAAAEPAAAALMANSLGVSTHSLDAGGSFYGAHSAPQQQHCAVAGDHYTRQASFTTTCSSAAGCSCYQAGAAAAAVVGSPMSATSNFHPLYSRQLAPQFSPQQQQQQPHFPAAAATTMMAVMPMAAGACDAAVYAGGCHAQCEQCSTAASTPRSANTPSSSSSSAVVMTPAAAAVEVHGDGATHNNTNDDDDGMFSHDAAAAQTTEYGYGYQHHPQQHYAAANDDAVADGDAVATAAAGYYDAYAASALPEPQHQTEEAAAVAVSTVPLLHAHVLSGVVPFVPYDRDARMMNMSTPPRCAVPREALCRLFIGQLPYTLSDSELAWCFFVLTNGQATIFYIERIVHWRNGRQPSGCVHAYCYPRDRDTILALNQRVLFDECGLWVASPQPPQSAVMSAERRALAEYCAFLSADKAHRAAQRPYQCMCVQLATSTYLPHLERQRRLHAARAAQASRPAVFSGAAAPAATRLFGAAAPAAAVPYYAMGARGAAAPAPSAYAQLAPHAW